MTLDELRKMLSRVSMGETAFAYFQTLKEAEGRRLYIYRRRSKLRRMFADGTLIPTDADIMAAADGEAFAGDSVAITIEHMGDAANGWPLPDKPYRLAFRRDTGGFQFTSE